MTRPINAIGYAMHSSRSHDAVIRVYDAAGNVIILQRPVGTMKRARRILSPLFYLSEALRVYRLRQRRDCFARPEKVRPVGLAEQTKEQRRILFRIHVVHETASQNRRTPQQALQQLFVLLILRLRSRHTLSVEAQLADHFGLGLHPIDFNA
jgi:hypothetical protein